MSPLWEFKPHGPQSLLIAGLIDTADDRNPASPSVCTYIYIYTLYYQNVYAFV